MTSLEFSGIVFIHGKINTYFIIFSDKKMKILFYANEQYLSYESYSISFSTFAVSST